MINDVVAYFPRLPSGGNTHRPYHIAESFAEIILQFLQPPLIVSSVCFSNCFNGVFQRVITTPQSLQLLDQKPGPLILQRICNDITLIALLALPRKAIIANT